MTRRVTVDLTAETTVYRLRSTTPTDRVAERRCVVCPQLRTETPRHYDHPHVCAGCRSRLRALLAEIIEHYALLDPQPGSPTGAKVSGSRNPPLPLALGPLDLTMPAHTHTVHDNHGDQVGDHSAATTLDSWARDWQTHRGELLPEPNVSTLAHWLTDRLDWACEHHPAVDDFAHELSLLASNLRTAAGLGRPPVEWKAGIPCRECEAVSLYRWPGSDYIECGCCALLMTPEEFTRWTQLIAAPEWHPWVREIATRNVA